MPWPLGLGSPGAPPDQYDSGDYPNLLLMVERRLDYPALRREQVEARERGEFLGIGIACYVERNAGLVARELGLPREAVAVVAGALYERLVYDESGQLQTGSFMDYLLPTASESPIIEVIHAGVPSQTNPLGVKGAGEGGCMGSPAAIAAAVEDALRPFGVRISGLPITPADLCAAIGPRMSRRPPPA